MKKFGFLLVAAGLAVSSMAYAGGREFNQPQGRHVNYGWQGGGGHGGGYHPQPRPQPPVVRPDPNNPSNVRDWSKPQAASVYCIGAGCQLQYPTPRQAGPTTVCNNSGCRR
ncbi:MAG TPA: hypothetical protein VHP58_04865 [Alphaproteobacteria bacterium]|nr:hypothetical protein [Alphaproteobacteria bacterium]